MNTAGPIFDVHVRLAPGPGALADLLSMMDGMRIGRAAVAAGGVVDLDRLSAQITSGGGVRTDPDNEAVLRACDGSGGRLLPFYFANPHREPDAYRREAHRYRGLELSPAVHGIGLNDRRTSAYVAVAADAGHPVYVVCLGRAGAQADDLVDLARRFPTTNFLFGHCGHIGIDTHGLSRIAPQANIVAEASGCLTVTARVAVQRLGPHRLLFGSEYPLQHPGVELAKFAALGLTDDDWHQISWINAHRLFGEDVP